MLKNKLKLGTAMCLALVLATPWQARAQEAVSAVVAAPADPTAPAAAPVADKQVYEPAYFTQFAPQTALDMLRRVPGFDIRSDEGDGRGLGQASANVLVNGKRLSGKSDGTISQVSRISAGDVVRIEIVDGATLDVPGLSGQVANLIVDVSKLSGQFEWDSEVRPLTDRSYFGAASASLSGAAGNLQYTVSLEHSGFRGGAQGLITRLDGSGGLIETNQYSNRASRDAPKAATNLKWSAGSTIVNFNASYLDSKFTNPQTELIDGTTSLDRDRFGNFRQDFKSYEIGGDAEFAAGPGKLKLIGLERADKSDLASDLREVYFNGDDNTGGRYAEVSDEGERIARAEYSWKMGGADWQVSAEAAFNRLDRVAALFELDPAGNLVEVSFPDNAAGVTESRYETLLSYSRPLAANLTLQVIAGAENSTLKQTGRADQSRTFWRPKGSVNLAWAAKKGLDLSLKLERRIGQLSFGDFLASVDLNNQTGNAGNAQLVPQQSWDTTLEVKKNLGKWGSSTLTLFNQFVQDRVEIIPVAGGGESLGNVPNSWRRSVNLASTIELAALGIAGGRLDFSANLRKSRLEDPLDGRGRPFSSNQYREFSLSYRQDIPKTSLAYGANLYHGQYGANYRLTEFSFNNEGPVFLSLFIEHKDIFGLKVNLSANNLLGADVDYRRVVYDGFRNEAPIAFAESGNLKFGRIYRLNISGSF